MLLNCIIFVIDMREMLLFFPGNLLYIFTTRWRHLANKIATQYNTIPAWQNAAA